VRIIIFQMELVEMDGISGANNHAQDQNLVGLEKTSLGWKTKIGLQSRPIQAFEGLNEQGLKCNVP
jgi:hypothetical protein